MVTILRPRNLETYSRTDRRYILTIEGIKKETITEELEGHFFVVAPYGKNPNRYRVWTRKLLFQSAKDEAEWILSSEHSVKEVFLLPIYEMMRIKGKKMWKQAVFTTYGLKTDDKITVCDSCYEASCFLGELYCGAYKTSGSIELNVARLLNEGTDEHPSYWVRSKCNAENNK